MLNAEIFDKAISDHIGAVLELQKMRDEIISLAEIFSTKIKQGAKILWMGNGGSAADCQHLAAEIVGRFVKERKGFPSIALTTDTSILTAVGNDYGYEDIFSRQIEALCNAGDVVVGISTSGNSKNVVKAIRLAKELGAFTVCFAGISGGTLAGLCDARVQVPTSITARIQEGHILVGHILCEYIDANV